MTQQAELLKNIDTLPKQYFGEIFDFVGYLQQKAQQAQAAAQQAVVQYENDDEASAYKAMAADTEREQEALEWCNAYFGPRS